MSRIGKQPIKIPEGVNVDIKDGEIIAKGPKGENRLFLHPSVKAVIEDGKVVVSVKSPEIKQERALWGLFRALIANLIVGVRVGFEKKLELQGIGFKANVQDKNLVLEVGFSHPVNVAVPEGIDIAIDKNIITITGINNDLVGSFAARIRSIKKPEPYLGKGIRYVGEVVRRKAGKAAKAGAAGK